MSSNSTRNRILDSAERMFAEHGYAGASIRRITGEAKVDLGAVRYHFGSKDALFGQVMLRRLRPLCLERIRRLEDLEKRSGSGTPSLEGIVATFVEPAVDLVTDEKHGRCWRKLIGRARVEPGGYLRDIQETYEQLVQRYLEAFRRALPGLSNGELTYRLYFLFGVQVNTLIDDGTLRAMGKGLPDLYQDPAGVVAAMVRFITAGMRAPASGSRQATAVP